MLASLSVPYVDTAAARLVLRLDAPPQHPLAVLDTRVGDASVRLAVLGSSHQAIVRVGDDSVSELVSCRTGGDPEHDGDRLPPSALRRSGSIEYTFRSSVCVLGKEPFDSAVATLQRLEMRDDALIARFPGDPLAVTALELVDPGRSAVVRWRSWHAYPQSGELVVTRSEVRRT